MSVFSKGQGCLLLPLLLNSHLGLNSNRGIVGRGSREAGREAGRHGNESTGI